MGKLVTLLQDLPTDKGNEASKKKRKELFSTFDPNGNGYLSLAECDRGLIQIGKELPKPIIIRAFHRACRVAQDDGKNLTREGENYIEYVEFRIFLLFLKKYAVLWEIFDELDTGDDGRVDLAEFTKGVAKLSKLSGTKITNAQEHFQKIDANGGGQILFDEFGDWGIGYVYPSVH